MAACAAILLAIIAVMIAVRLWFQEQRETRPAGWTQKQYSTTTSNILFYVLIVLAQIEVAFWIKLLNIVDSIHTAKIGIDMDFPPANLWDINRPLIFSVLWALLAIRLESANKIVKLLLVLCGLVSILSYVADYCDVYYFYLNYHDGIGNPWIDYWRFGLWDVVRGMILPILLVCWLIEFKKKSRRLCDREEHQMVSGRC
jgi:hypothetical protein